MSFTGKPQTFLATEIPNDGFFPNLSLGDLQMVYRIPAEYQQEMVATHLRLAMSDCNHLLAVRRQEWISLGFTTLQAVADAEQGLDVMFVHQYIRAVFMRAKGLMLMQFATLNRREQAENLAKESEETYQECLAQSGRAIRRLMGLTENVSVELL